MFVPTEQLHCKSPETNPSINELSPMILSTETQASVGKGKVLKEKPMTQTVSAAHCETKPQT